MSLEYRQFVYPAAAQNGDVRYTFELKRNRLRQPIVQQRVWMQLKQAYPELAHELSPAYAATMRQAINEPDAPRDPNDLVQLTDEDQLHLRMFPVAVSLARLVSVVDRVTTDDPLIGGIRWSSDMGLDGLRSLFEWFLDDPDRYEYINSQVDALFNPNPVEMRPARELTADDRIETDGPNSVSAEEKPGAH